MIIGAEHSVLLECCQHCLRAVCLQVEVPQCWVFTRSASEMPPKAKGPLQRKTTTLGKRPVQDPAQVETSVNRLEGCFRRQQLQAQVEAGQRAAAALAAQRQTAPRHPSDDDAMVVEDDAPTLGHIFANSTQEDQDSFLQDVAGMIWDEFMPKFIEDVAHTFLFDAKKERDAQTAPSLAAVMIPSVSSCGASMHTERLGAKELVRQAKIVHSKVAVPGAKQFPAWKQAHPWLERRTIKERMLDGSEKEHYALFCTLCEKMQFVNGFTRSGGCTTFKGEALQRHEMTKDHKAAANAATGAAQLQRGITRQIVLEVRVPALVSCSLLCSVHS